MHRRKAEWVGVDWINLALDYWLLKKDQAP
jgi:hypothetical protein